MERGGRSLVTFPTASEDGRWADAIDGTTARFGGSWGFDTGSPNATWIGGMALVKGARTDAGGPVIRWGWVPADRARVPGSAW